MCTCAHDRPHELLQFVEGLNLQALCDVASELNKGLPCVAGGWSCGGYNIIQEVVFEDGSCWLARIPRPDNSVLHGQATSSYSAVLRYLKKKSSISVPTVFHHALSTDETNKVGAPYVLMEKLPGKQLPALGQTKDEPYDRDRPTRQEIRLTRKIHEQLTEIIIGLARHQFNRIGALHEDECGNFTVEEYFDPIWIGCSSERAKVFKSLRKCDRGPYDSITAYYLGIAELNYQQALTGPPEVYGPEGVDLYETLADMSLCIALPEFEKGPFVIAHNDLTLQNILVDDDFNITGILDFPGNIVPLPSLCVYPWMFHWNAWGAMCDREEFEKVFLSKHSDNEASPIASVASRRQIMADAINRNYFERSLLGSFAFVFVPTLHERLYGETYVYRKPDEVVESGTEESQPSSDGAQDSQPESNSSLASDAGEAIGRKSEPDSELNDFSNAESIITSTPPRAVTKSDALTQTEPSEVIPPHSTQLDSLESCSAELLEIVTAGKPKRSRRGLSSWWKGFMPGRTDGATRKRKSRFLYQLDKLGIRILNNVGMVREKWG